jgi:hypothetical protein
MQAASVIRIEKNVDRAASALFALACGYAANLWFAADLEQPVLGAAATAAAAFAYLMSIRALNAVQPRSERLPVPIFDVREVEPMAPSELLLTDRIDEPPAASAEPLLLDDILAQIEPGSRVVRLFDPAAMPRAGAVRARVDLHLEGEISKEQSIEAAQALHDALAELRRSLR